MLQVLAGSLHPSNTDVFSLVVALEGVYRRCKGAFACVAQISEDMMVGFRDPHGLKPLVLGERHRPDASVDYMFASESVVLDKLEFTNIRNVMPGSCDSAQSRHESTTTLTTGCRGGHCHQQIWQNAAAILRATDRPATLIYTRHLRVRVLRETGQRA